MGRLLDIAKATLVKTGAGSDGELESASAPIAQTQNVFRAIDQRAANRCTDLAEHPCWHCGGSRQCDCINCGQYETYAVWTAGRCLPCEARERQQVQ